MSFRISSFCHELQVDTIPTHERVTQLSQVILAEREGAVGSEGQQDKKPRIAGMQVEGGEDPKGKGKGKQKSPKGDEEQKAKASDTAKGDNKPKATSEPKATTQPQCWKWVEDGGCQFGNTCQCTHSPEVKGRCYNCGLRTT